MKRIASLLLILTMTAISVLSLASCSAYGGIEKRFIDADYQIVNIDDNATAKTLKAEIEEMDVSCTIHLLKKTTSAFGVGGYVLILEFASAGDIDKIFGEDGSETIKGIIKDAQKSDYVNDNCVLVPLTLAYAEEALELFKK